MRERQREKRKNRGAEMEKESLRFREAKKGKGEKKIWTGRKEGGERETEKEERQKKEEMKGEKEQGGKQGPRRKEDLLANAPKVPLHSSGRGVEGAQILEGTPLLGPLAWG